MKQQKGKITMKRTLSLILALFMLLTVVAVLPLSAEEVQLETTVYHSVDFADRYKDGNFSQAVDADDLGIGVTPVSMNLSGKNITEGNFYNKLTENGLEFATVNGRTAGFALEQYDLTQNTTYTISLDMKATTPATNSYIYFGFGFDATLASYNAYAAGTNFRYNGSAKLLVNGSYAADASAPTGELWTDIVTNAEVVNYKFEVVENKLKNVIVTCGTHTATFTNATDTALDASKGAFGMTWRSAANDANPSSVLKNISVTVGSETVYSVDFAAMYTAKGLTAPADAIAISGVGVGVIDKATGENSTPATASDIVTQLNANGYTFGTTLNHTTGIVIDDFDLTKYENYIISMDMSIDFPSDGANAYIYFGFGYDAEKLHYETFASKTNMRWNGKVDNVSALLINNFTQSGDFTDLWTKTITDAAVVNYQFVVEHDMLVKVIATCGDKVATYTLAGGMDASAGTFGLNLRAGNNSVAPKATVKKLEVLSHVASDADPIINILSKDRVLATQPTLTYEDTKTTKYVDGYVLHNMDFSKVENFDQTGYFVTNDAEPVGFEIKDGNLNIITNGSDNVKMMMTGNSIPKNIQNYTVNIKFRFNEYSPKYFCYIQGNTLDAATGKTSGEKNTCIRYNGTIDNASYLSKYADAYTQLLAKMQAGEWVEMTYSALDRNTGAIVLTCGEYTVKWTKTANTAAPLDSYMGILVGAGSNIDISTIQVVAGYYEDYEALIWPSEENALVQTVDANAIKVVTPDQPSTPSTPSTPSEDEGENTTTAPTPETNAPETNAPTTQASTVTEESGCQSVLSLAPVSAILLCAIPLVKRKKKD